MSARDRGTAWSLGYFTSTCTWLGVGAVLRAGHRAQRAAAEDRIGQIALLVAIALYLCAAVICFLTAWRCFKASATLLGSRTE